MGKALETKDYDAIRKQIMLTSKAIAREEEIFPTNNFVPRFYVYKDYTVICKSKEEEKQIRFNFGGLFYDFKKAVAEKFRIPIKHCKLLNKGEPIKTDYYFKAMNECSFAPGPFELIESKDEVNYVKNALNDRLEKFFDLLGEGEVEKEAWQIVAQLPLSKKVLETVHESRYPWAEITNDSIYRQLYMLKAMSCMGE